MGKDGEGGMFVLPSAPARARYSEAMRNSEPKETGDSVGGLAILPSAPPETGNAIGSLDALFPAPPEHGDMESDSVVGLPPTVPLDPEMMM